MNQTSKVAHRSVFSVIAWIWGVSLVFLPLLYVLAISFMPRGTYGGIELGFTLANFKKVFSGELTTIFAETLARSIWLATLNTVLCVLVAFPLALFLFFKAGKWKQVLFFLLIVPFWTNFLIRIYAWFVLLSDKGWINSLLESIGFGPEYLHLLFTPQAVLLGMFYNYLPYMAMSLYVSVEKLDISLLEAADDLGAGPFRRFFKIILPLCTPGLIAGSIMVFIPSLGEFVIPDVLGGGTKLYLGNLLAQQFLTVRNWPLGAALTVLLICLMAGTLWAFEKFGRGKTEDLLS